MVRQGRVSFESRPEREDLPGKMVAAGSTEQTGGLSSIAAGRYGSRSGSSPPEKKAKKFLVCVLAVLL